MDVDKLSNEEQELEKRFLQFKQFWDNLVQQSNLLDKEKLSLCDQLRKLNLQIDDLQIKKTQLDELKRKLELDAHSLSEKCKQYEFLKTRFETLNQSKDQLEKYSLTKGLEFEENMLNQKINEAWKYFNDKNSKLDDEIKDLELKLANQQEKVSKMFKTECDKYKKSIEELINENSVLTKKLSLISKIREDSNV